MTLWVLLSVAWLLPCIISMVVNYGFGDVSHYPGTCFVDQSIGTRIFVETISYYLPFVVMLIMSIALIVICCKQRGKEPDSPFTRQSLISCCACAVAYMVLCSFQTMMMFFRFYEFWMIANFLAMCLPGMLCLLWLLICKDIRASALCKAPSSGEKAELIPK